MERAPFRKLSYLSSTHFFVLLIQQISFTTSVSATGIKPIKNKNGSSLVTETNNRSGMQRRWFGLLPAKVGCIYRIPRLTVNPNFASALKALAELLQ